MIKYILSYAGRIYRDWDRCAGCRVKTLAYILIRRCVDNHPEFADIQGFKDTLDQQGVQFEYL